MSFDPQTEREKKAAAAAQVVAPQLDPAFPWRVIAFDPAAFGVLADPPAPDKSQTSGDD